MNPLLHLNQRGVLCMTSLQFSRAFCVTNPNPLRVLSDLCVSSLQFLSGLSVGILKSKLLPPTQPLTNKRGVLSGLCVSNR
jgi:hypothetical protein